VWRLPAGVDDPLSPNPMADGRRLKIDAHAAAAARWAFETSGEVSQRERSAPRTYQRFQIQLTAPDAFANRFHRLALAKVAEGPYAPGVIQRLAKCRYAAHGDECSLFVLESQRNAG
jgi:hypothetical protein